MSRLRLIIFGGILVSVIGAVAWFGLTSDLDNNPVPSIFGVNISPTITNLKIGDFSVAEVAVQADAYWTRSHIYWWWVEPDDGGNYQWIVDVNQDGTPETSIDKEISGLVESGLNPVIILHGTPGWADGNESPDSSCRPVAPDYYDDFARFAAAVVERYDGDGNQDAPGSPRVSHWEIWNEPDAPIGIANLRLGPDEVIQNGGVDGYGCWRNDNNPEGSGAKYRELLQETHTAIKSADPTATIVLGGLALDCSSNFDPGGSVFSTSCTATQFLEGLLGAVGAPQPFDMAAFHSYAYWGDVKLDWDLYFGEGAYLAEGGLTLAKYRFLRKTFDRYGIPDIPILLNETGLLCTESYELCLRYDADPNDETPPREISAENFYDDHANFVIRQYTRAWANGIEGVLWYSMYGEQWRDSDFIGRGGVPKPGYNALYFIANELENAQFAENISTAEYEGYRFCKGFVDYRIYWTNEDISTTLPEQPGFSSTKYDKIGTEISVDAVSFDPILIKNILFGRCASQ